MNLTILRQAFDEKHISLEPEEIRRHAPDGLTPEAMVYPGALPEAAELVKLANREKFSLAPRGAGVMSSVGGRLKSADVILSTRRLDKTIDLDLANLTVTAQAGAIFGDLQDLLAGSENRCFFPLDGRLKETADYICSDRDYMGAFIPVDPPLAEKITLGEMLAVSLTGPTRLRNRLLRDLVLGVRFIAPTGEIIGMGGKTVKNVSGYDASKLMIGSLGCLGLIGEVTLRLLPLPESQGGIIAIFSGLEPAGRFCESMLKSRLLPTALELMNQPAWSVAGPDRPEMPREGFAVALGQAGFEEEVRRERVEILARADQAAARDILELDGRETSALFKRLGDTLLSRATIKLKANYRFSGYLEFMAEVERRRQGWPWAACCSAGNGVTHLYLSDRPDLKAGTGFGLALRDKALALNGALFVEAAPPEFKDLFDPWGPPRGDFEIMKRLKKELDPAGIFNPGRFPGGL
ncbi:MAG: FAD-binding oxidoreductase [Thermodesulfobacteriota bacterium]